MGANTNGNFFSLMKERRIETAWTQELREADCLLCSEENPIIVTTGS
jgi:hypothetical protein